MKQKPHLSLKVEDDFKMASVLYLQTNDGTLGIAESNIDQINV